MTSFRIDRVRFDSASLATWAAADPSRANWPVVYTIEGLGRVYVGETTQVITRMRQHLARADRRELTSVRVVIDKTFNKSACLDLESFLIQLFSGDGKYVVDNANAGLSGANYYERDRYREQFTEIFDQLRSEGLFAGSIAQIENSDLFKLSPYKALHYDQRVAILEILERLFEDLRSGVSSTAVIQGQPGTGKTIVGIYLMKLLCDIRHRTAVLEDTDSDAIFSGFFTDQNAALLEDFRMGLVIPQQSLRKTVEKVFKKTSGLSADLVLSPFRVGESQKGYDLLIVDEAHRLQQLSATLPTLITKFKSINANLFNGDERGGHQLDWICLKSNHRIFLLDPEQTVKPADIPARVIGELEREAARSGRRFSLRSQMRVRAGEDYVGYVRAMLSQHAPARAMFADYDLRLFDDLGEMREAILAREAETGLSRLVAGYAWKWRSKTDKSMFDIEIDGQQLQWNTTTTDWISSSTSIHEVGSIHTTQGYDLNFAGVIIGPDLRFDPTNQRLYIVRDSYFDSKGKANNRMLGVEYSDEDLLTYITNIYVVLLTRGILGTYVYVCDPALRSHLANFIPQSGPLFNPHRSDAAGTVAADAMHPYSGGASPDPRTIHIELGEAPPEHTEPVSAPERSSSTSGSGE